MLKKFDQVDKALGKNSELKSFKALLEKKPEILLELDDYEGFREKIWISHIAKIKINTKMILELYKKRKVDLEAIIRSANNDVDKWNTTIEVFNSRFYVPFHIKLSLKSKHVFFSELV
ncbi:hypothetical protein [Acinetobacter wanghuae]|uniref:hypothetical protein n=1 Tax=Acinetobacter wanghuae TaxID=2662362 RepID=UPI003AF47AB3